MYNYDNQHAIAIAHLDDDPLCCSMHPSGNQILVGVHSGLRLYSIALVSVEPVPAGLGGCVGGGQEGWGSSRRAGVCRKCEDLQEELGCAGEAEDDKPCCDPQQGLGCAGRVGVCRKGWGVQGRLRMAETL